jgi:hypothetical protein
MENKIIEIPVKVIFIGEFQNWEQWIANVNICSQKYGVTSQLLHQDCNGFRTSGYDLKMTIREKVYPVKTYLLVQDPEVKTATPFKSLTSN